MTKNTENNVDLQVQFSGLMLKNPVMLASGTCGYADELNDFVDLGSLGGLITKSISPLPKTGNPTPRIVETDAGMLNAIGLANMGLEEFLKTKITVLETLNTTIFVNVAGQTIDDYLHVAEQLSQEKAINGLELNISCPNVKKGGISFGTDPEQVYQITRSVKSVCDSKPLMVKLTPTVTDISATAQAAVEGGADALSMINTFTAMVIDIEKQKPVLANRTGGLSGPAIKPIAVYLVNKVYREVTQKVNIPILGGGGIRTASDAIEFLLAGASAVTVGTATFVRPDCSEQIIEGIRKYCIRKGIFRISDLTGALK